MASSPPHKAMPRRLFEVLKEQQEPFTLMLERRTVQSKATTFLCWRPKRKRGGSTTKFRCWGVIIKRALNWWHSSSSSSSSSSSRAPQHGRWRSISDCFAEATSTSRRRVGGGFHRLSCSGGDSVDVVAESNGNRDTEWKEYELSPVSVLDVHSDEDSSSVHNHPMEKQSSCSLDSATEAGGIRLAPLPLFKETSEREKTCLWENQWGDLAPVANLISLYFDESRMNWCQFLDQKREVAIEIEGFILEELEEECLLDML